MRRPSLERKWLLTLSADELGTALAERDRKSTRFVREALTPPNTIVCNNQEGWPGGRQEDVTEEDMSCDRVVKCLATEAPRVGSMKLLALSGEARYARVKWARDIGRGRVEWGAVFDMAEPPAFRVVQGEAA